MQQVLPFAALVLWSCPAPTHPLTLLPRKTQCIISPQPRKPSLLISESAKSIVHDEALCPAFYADQGGGLNSATQGVAATSHTATFMYMYFLHVHVLPSSTCTVFTYDLDIYVLSSCTTFMYPPSPRTAQHSACTSLSTSPWSQLLVLSLFLSVSCFSVCAWIGALAAVGRIKAPFCKLNAVRPRPLLL